MRVFFCFLKDFPGRLQGDQLPGGALNCLEDMQVQQVDAQKGCNSENGEGLVGHGQIVTLNMVTWISKYAFFQTVAGALTIPASGGPTSFYQILNNMI